MGVAAVALVLVLQVGAGRASASTCQFDNGFATLKVLLAERMGDPLGCPFVDPRGSGDVHQETTTGLAYWRKASNLAVFTDGDQHWAWTIHGPAYWRGSAVEPPAAYLVAEPPPVLEDRVQLSQTLERAPLRFYPTPAETAVAAWLQAGEAVAVTAVVRGADDGAWYRTAEGDYIAAGAVAFPTEPPRRFTGRWIDVDLREPARLTAYEDDQVVRSALVIKGRTQNSTPRGVFTILKRVENETMDSATIGIPRAAPGGYYLTDVLYTQYFTAAGASLHFNYWSSAWGLEGSHGCLGLSYADARFLWDWAAVGTPISIHD
jgi:lipoprotein-anchoring transpeptidase ErfK/SrfK